VFKKYKPDGSDFACCMFLKMQDQVFKYTRRTPEKTVLYKIISENLETFLAETNMHDGRGVPSYVEKEMREYLKCGILAHGFIRVRCENCKKEGLVAFSCKKRGFCPSCGGKRMSETAAHLVDNLIPKSPLRQWVLSVPIPLRYWLAANPKLQTKILEIVIRAINGYYRKKLKARYELKNLSVGSVTLVQRFGSALNLNVHFHILYVDGGYEIREKEKVFYKLPELSDNDIKDMIKKISDRIIRYLRKRGYLEDAFDDALQFDNPAFAKMLGASTKNLIAFGPNKNREIRKFIGSGFGYEEDLPILNSKLCAAVNGFSLHANTLVKANQRKRLETLCKYVLRPPVAEERLSFLNNGDVCYKLKKRWTDGTSHIIFTQMEFMEKLAALAPPPRAHQVRFHGFLAPHSKNRPKLATSRKELKEQEKKKNDEITRALDKNGKIKWAKLLKRVFNIDITICDSCGGKTKMLSSILDEKSIKKILTHIGLDPNPPPVKPAKQIVIGF
jgi:ribosomal protein S27E